MRSRVTADSMPESADSANSIDIRAADVGRRPTSPIADPQVIVIS
jgi:hypothetical protein